MPGLTPSPGHLSFMELGPEPGCTPGEVRGRGPLECALSRAEAGPLASRFQLAAPATARASEGVGRAFVQWRPHPLGGPLPCQLTDSLTCSHPGFPHPTPVWEARPDSTPAGRRPSCSSSRSLILCTCFLPPCEVRACTVCSPALPWHPPWAILSGVGRQPDSCPARSQLWAGLASAPPTPSASLVRVLLSGWVSCTLAEDLQVPFRCCLPQPLLQSPDQGSLW